MTRERLQKVLAARGVAARRAAEALIERGAVSVNGTVAVLGQSVDPERDDIRVNGRLIEAVEGARYIALHKPEGYVTSTVSVRGERTVMDLVDLHDRFYPVGRLDLDTAGLLFMTNDGAWANLVTHPRYEVEKEYVAVVRGHPTPGELDTLRRGVRLPTGTVTAPADVEVLQRTDTGVTLRITVHEGKKRQIRLMLAAIGHPVLRLTRTRVGPVRLGALPPGRWRDLTAAEVEALRTAGAEHGRRSHD